MFEISLVSPDLSPDETILQMADVLERLNEVTEEVFGRITERIQRNVERIEGIDRRIEHVSDRVWDTVTLNDCINSLFCVSLRKTCTLASNLQLDFSVI